MNENTNEGKLDANEGGQPTPTLQAETQPSSGDLAKMQAKLDELDRAYRALQSEKDRGVKKVAADVERINKALRLKEKGLDEDEIMHRLKVDELYDRGTSPEPVVPSPVATARQDTYLDEATRFVQESGLDPADPEVVKLMIGHASEADYLRLAVRKLKAPAPEGAGAQPMKPEGVAKKDMDALINSYVEKVNANRGNKAAIRAIQEEYRKQGVEVERIDPLRR